MYQKNKCHYIQSSRDNWKLKGDKNQLRDIYYSRCLCNFKGNKIHFQLSSFSSYRDLTVYMYIINNTK